MVHLFLMEMKTTVFPLIPARHQMIFHAKQPECHSEPRPNWTRTPPRGGKIQFQLEPVPNPNRTFSNSSLSSSNSSWNSSNLSSNSNSHPPGRQSHNFPNPNSNPNSTPMAPWPPQLRRSCHTLIFLSCSLPTAHVLSHETFAVFVLCRALLSMI